MNKDEAKKVLEKVLNKSKERNKNYSELLSYDEEQALSYALTLFDEVDSWKADNAELSNKLNAVREIDVEEILDELDKWGDYCKLMPVIAKAIKSKIDETIGEGR